MSKNNVLSEGALDNSTRKIINDNLADVSQCDTQFDADSGTTSTTLTNISGMVTDILKKGTYHVYIHLDCLSTGNGGTKFAFKFGTASMLSSIAVVAKAFTASGVAVSRATTATDQASLQAATAANICVIIEGVVVVGAEGTLQLQAAQNASHADNTLVYTSSFMKLTPIGATVGNA